MLTASTCDVTATIGCCYIQSVIISAQHCSLQHKQQQEQQHMSSPETLNTFITGHELMQWQ